MANEKRLIDANALKRQITRYHMSLTPRYISKLVDAEIGDVIDIIDEEPTVDAVEVVHGRWIEGLDGSCMCSNCNRVIRYEIGYYCPNCGAKMDGERKEN